MKKKYAIVTKFWFFIMIIFIIGSVAYSDPKRKLNSYDDTELTLEDINSYFPIKGANRETDFILPEEFKQMAVEESWGQISEDNIINYVLYIESQYFGIEKIKECYFALGYILETIRKTDFLSFTIEEAFMEVDFILVERLLLDWSDESKGTFTEDLLSRQVDCDSISYLYLAISDELNWPVYGIFVPNHMFVRWDDGLNVVNFETTSGYVASSSDFLFDHSNEGGGGIIKDHLHLNNLNNHIYMDNLSVDEIIGAIETCIGTKLYFEDEEIDYSLEHLERGLKYYPNLPALKYYVAYIYAFEKERYSESLDLVDSALSYSPQNVEFFRIKSDILRLMNLFDESFDAILSAYIINPNHPGTLWTLGWYYYEMGDLDAAIRLSNESYKIDNEPFGICLNLGLYYLLNGNAKKSKVFYKKAFKIGDKLEVYEVAIEDLENSLDLGIYSLKEQVIQEKIQSLQNEFE